MFAHFVIYLELRFQLKPCGTDAAGSASFPAQSASVQHNRDSTQSTVCNRTSRFKQAVIGGRPRQYVPARVTFTVDLLTLKVVSESRVTWATSCQFWSSLAAILDLGPMYATTDVRQTDIRQHHSLMPSRHVWVSAVPTVRPLSASTLHNEDKVARVLTELAAEDAHIHSAAPQLSRLQRPHRHVHTPTIDH